MAYPGESAFKTDEFIDESRDGGDLLALHTENLFDQDNDEAGSHLNLINGEPFDNSTETDITLIVRTGLGRIIDISRKPRKLDGYDAAAAWLDKHDHQNAA